MTIEVRRETSGGVTYLVAQAPWGAHMCAPLGTPLPDEIENIDRWYGRGWKHVQWVQEAVMVSRYGSTFDRLVDRWAVLESEHDQHHPDRDVCGGVGGCAMMFAATGLEQRMIEALEAWRAKIPHDWVARP